MAASREDHVVEPTKAKKEPTKRKMTVISSLVGVGNVNRPHVSRKMKRKVKPKQRKTVVDVVIKRQELLPKRSTSTKNRKLSEKKQESVRPSTKAKTALQSKVIAGASLVKHKPLFSYDSKYLFVITNNVVRVYSAATGECVHRLCAHTADVVSICISPKNHLQLISCYEDGKLVYWDYSDGIFHKEFKLNTRIHKAVFPTADGPFYILNEKLHLIEVKKADQSASEWKRVLGGVAEPDHVVVGFKGTFAARIRMNRITVVFLDDTEKQYQHIDHFNQKFTCITTHPSDYCIATGDVMGRIFVWFNFKKEQFSRTVLHWHQLPVADLAFTYAGSNLISGGGECAIVRWKIDSDTRSYIPRLGMPICHLAVSPDNSLIASCHVDNGIQFISNTGNIVQVIQGLTQGHQWKEFDVPPVPTGILYDPQTRSMVLNGKPGHLQFYSLQEDKQLFNLDITGYNYQHSERNFKVLPTEVKKAAFDPKGDWLVTVELRNDRVTSADMCLKFWQYSSRKQNFVLNTSVEHAHLAEIISVKFQPDGIDKDRAPLAITCGLDKRFKIWSLADDSDIYEKRQSWNCDSVGYFRDLVPGDVGFSEDGTIVGITFSNIVTLWLPESNVLKATLSSPLNQEEIKQVQFGSGGSSHLLVCSSENSLSVWNVLSLTVQWCISLSGCTLTKDCTSEIMAVFTKENLLFVFNPSEPKPIYSEEIVTPAPIICSAFIPRHENVATFTQAEKGWNAGSCLYFMNAEQTLYEIMDSRLQEVDEDHNKVVMQQKLPLTPFGNLIAQQMKRIEPSTRSSETPSSTSDLIKELIMAPSNTLPPIKIQCLSLLADAFLLPKKQVEQQDNRVHVEVESDESDIDADPYTSTEFKVELDCAAEPTKSDFSHKEDIVTIAAERSFSWLRKVWQSCG